MNSGHRFFCMVRKCVECKCHTNQNFACHICRVHHQEIGLTAVVDSTTLTTPLAKGSFEQKVLDCVERGTSAIPVFGRIPGALPKNILHTRFVPKFANLGVVRNCFVLFLESRLNSQVLFTKRESNLGYLLI